MEKTTEKGRMLRDWASLVRSCARNGAPLPGVEDLQAHLEAILAQAGEAEVRHARKAVVQRLEEMVITPIRRRRRGAKREKAATEPHAKDDPSRVEPR